VRVVDAWYRPMRARGREERHRPATPLELLFDLSFVVAVAFASERLHHAISEDHVADGVAAYAMVFFAIWWAWMNFTWFASAYDTDDVPYRLATLVQIGGVLVVAASVPRAFDANFAGVTLGYGIMRLALAGQWLRASRADPQARATDVRYAAGITACMAGWVLLLVLPPGVRPAAFAVMVLAELAVPVWAERRVVTRWHAGHIAERYGLFTIIVLGETILAATIASQAGLEAGEETGSLVALAVSGLVIVFAMWWVYFDQPAHLILTSNRVAFPWGYGHYLIFSSAAAVGAGLGVTVDHATHHAHVSRLVAALAVAVPVTIFLVSVWALHVRPHRRGRVYDGAFLLAAALSLATTVMPFPLPALAAVMAGLVAAGVVSRHRPAPTPEPAT
jgi:low temperature requirement protein LtrA